MHKILIVEMNNKPNSIFTFLNFIVSLSIFGLFMYGLFYIASGIYKILLILTPVLLLIALVLDYRVPLQYLRNMWSRLKSYPLSGIFQIILTIFGLPLVALYLVLKASLSSRINKLQQNYNEQLKNMETDYEVIDSKMHEPDQINSSDHIH